MFEIDVAYGAEFAPIRRDHGSIVENRVESREARTRRDHCSIGIEHGSICLDHVDSREISRGVEAGRDRRLATRDAAERLIDLGTHLAPHDRAAIASIYGAGMSIPQLAAARGVRARTVQRQVHRVIKRMTGRPFAIVLERGGEWPILTRRVAQAVILRGTSLRQTARELGVTIYRVRLEIARIREICNDALCQPTANDAR